MRVCRTVASIVHSCPFGFGLACLSLILRAFSIQLAPRTSRVPRGLGNQVEFLSWNPTGHNRFTHSVLTPVCKYAPFLMVSIGSTRRSLVSRCILGRSPHRSVDIAAVRKANANLGNNRRGWDYSAADRIRRNTINRRWCWARLILTVHDCAQHVFTNLVHDKWQDCINFLEELLNRILSSLPGELDFPSQFDTPNSLYSPIDLRILTLKSTRYIRYFTREHHMHIILWLCIDHQIWISDIEKWTLAVYSEQLSSAPNRHYNGHDHCLEPSRTFQNQICHMHAQTGPIKIET